MLLFGFLAGIVAVTFFYEISGRNSEVERSIAKLWKRPFISAFILCLTFLIAAFALDAYLKTGSDDFESVFFKPETYVLVFKELFFAFAIAMFIIATVELSSRQEQEKLLSKATKEHKKFIASATKEIRSSVFDAVYERLIDPTVIDEVEQCIFEQDFVRTRHSRDIVLKAIEAESDYVLLESTQTFRIKNVTRQPKDYLQKVFLPRPPLRRLQDRNSVESISIFAVQGSGVRGDLIFNAEAGQQAMQKALRKSSTSDETVFEFPPVLIEPGSEIEVVISLVLAKEKFDNELWTSLVPTLEAEVTVRAEIDGLRLGAMSLHRGAMTPIGSDQEDAKTKKWRVEKPLLSYQGYLVSWSAQEPAGDASRAREAVAERSHD